MSALIVSRNLERAAGAGRRLLEDEGDVASFETGPFVAGVLGRFELRSEIEKLEGCVTCLSVRLR